MNEHLSVKCITEWQEVKDLFIYFQNLDNISQMLCKLVNCPNKTNMMRDIQGTTAPQYQLHHQTKFNWLL